MSNIVTPPLLWIVDYLNIEDTTDTGQANMVLSQLAVISNRKHLIMIYADQAVTTNLQHAFQVSSISRITLRGNYVNAVWRWRARMFETAS